MNEGFITVEFGVVNYVNVFTCKKYVTFGLLNTSL
jgi:hypothetical protein